MPPLEYRLHPRRHVVIGGVVATLLGFAMAGWSLVLGLLVGGLFLGLSLVGLLPFFIREHRLVITDDYVQLPAGRAWSSSWRRLRYAEIEHVRGAVEAGDTSISLHDRDGHEHAIVADLLPSRADFELVVRTVLEHLARVRAGARRITPGAETGSENPSV